MLRSATPCCSRRSRAGAVAADRDARLSLTRPIAPAQRRCARSSAISPSEALVSGAGRVHTSLGGYTHRCRKHNEPFPATSQRRCSSSRRTPPSSWTRTARSCSPTREIEQTFGYCARGAHRRARSSPAAGALRATHSGHRARFDARRSRGRWARDSTLLGLHKSGREFPVEISLSPVPSGDGMLIVARFATLRRGARPSSS